ncbi:MAG TPA: hypothetical protein VGR42_10420 [Casimicrobiaceae bacterium]|nr:hypothetical protein [Casimicrobiaceae bacterium]
MELPPSPGPAVDRASRRWFATVLAATIVCLFAAAAFVVWVDPFQQYHLASRFPPRFYFLHHRYIDPGLAKNQPYDTVVSGSSIMENTRNDFVARVCGGAAVNLSRPAMSASEQRLMLETALADRPLKRVIMVLDFNEFAGGVEDRWDIAGPLPRYLYDRNPFNDLPYLLSWDVVVKSWRIVRGDASEKFTSDPNGAWFWGNVKQFGREEVLRGLDLAHLNARYEQPQRTIEGMRASFDHNLLALFRSYPNTEFDLVWPPYSILVWIDFAQRGQLDVSLEFKRYVAEATRGLSNVDVIDLQAERSITHDLDRYTDLYHFDPVVNEWLVESACKGRNRVNASNLDSYDRRIREQVAAASTTAGLTALTASMPGAARERDPSVRVP